jgi:hypothetical protein
MNFSDLIKETIEKWADTPLKSEKKIGKANQVDYSGYLFNNELRIEIERRREDPVNNVVKAWRQAIENDEDNFILIHVFSGYYKTKQSKKKNAIFIGEQMLNWARINKKNIRYDVITVDFIPPQGNPNIDIIDYETIKNIQVQINKLYLN